MFVVLFFLVVIQVDIKSLSKETSVQCNFAQISAFSPRFILPSDYATGTTEENSSFCISSYHNSQSSTVEGSSISAIILSV